MSTTATIGIRAAAYALPQAVNRISDWGAANSAPPGLIEALRGNGVDRYYDSDDAPLTHLAVAAAQKAIAQAGIEPDEIDMLIYAHTSVLSVAPPPASIVSLIQQKLALRRAVSFCITQQNCTSVLVAMRMARATMIAQPQVGNALVVSADQMRGCLKRYRPIADAGVHSDGACAVLLSRTHTENTVCAIRSAVDGRSFLGRLGEMEPNPNLYLLTVAMLRRTIRAAGISVSDIQWIMPHHVAQSAWLKIMALLNLPEDRLFDMNFSSKGHVFGCDPIINFADFLDRTPDASGYVVLYSTGLDGCQAAAVIRC